MANGYSATGRLFRVLKDASKRDNGQAFLEMWAGVFGLDAKNRVEAYAKYAEVLGLVVEAKREIAQHEELKQSLYLATVANIENILVTANPGAVWGTVNAQLQGPNLLALEFCADTLDRLAAEQEIESAFLTEFRQEVERLTTEVLASDEEEELKQLLVRKLGELRQATIDYALNGISGIREVVASSVGAVVLAGAVASKEPRRKVVQDFLDILSKATGLTEKAVKHWPLAAGAIRGLLGGAGE